jgi:acyl-CoA thioester hydrolase
MAIPKPMLVELSFRAKTYDIDYAGIVHNSVYIRWLEDLRLKIMDDYYPFEEMLANNQSPILEKTEINYRAPLRLFEEVNGQMWVSKLGKARWEVQAEFVRADLVIAQAKQTGYFMDLERYRPIRIPEVMRAQWEQDGG